MTFSSTCNLQNVIVIIVNDCVQSPENPDAHVWHLTPPPPPLDI